mmetsp:Transcript_7652/g.16846  ORF Transcript_7652/g.16846 Transcript_7652/m.16846 type:complete len:262 (+) Transcript_7652:1412-2197(+)
MNAWQHALHRINGHLRRFHAGGVSPHERVKEGLLLLRHRLRVVLIQLLVRFLGISKLAIKEAAVWASCSIDAIAFGDVCCLQLLHPCPAPVSQSFGPEDRREHLCRSITMRGEKIHHMFKTELADCILAHLLQSISNSSYGNDIPLPEEMVDARCALTARCCRSSHILSTLRPWQWAEQIGSSLDKQSCHLVLTIVNGVKQRGCGSTLVSPAFGLHVGTCRYQCLCNLWLASSGCRVQWRQRQSRVVSVRDRLVQINPFAG